jgi:hypothetical protein
MQSSRVFRADLLKDQTVIVTGGGSGIGRAIAFEAGRLGARVAIGARKPERLKETLDALRAEGITAWAHPLEIREPEQCEAFERGVTEHLGPPDALVNNAGGQFPSPAADIRVKGWRAVVADLRARLPRGVHRPEAGARHRADVDAGAGVGAHMGGGGELCGRSHFCGGLGLAASEHQGTADPHRLHAGDGDLGGRDQALD